MNAISALDPVLAASILDPLYETLGTVLSGFYAIVPSFGLAIALLTVTVRVAMIPLTAKQVRSQQAMQRLSPQLKALQAKHKGDRQKLNEETMKFYKEHNFNPLSGCLPVLLQAPLFIVLYRLIADLNARPPKHLPVGSSIYDALLASGGSMVSWGMDLARSARDAQGFTQALPFYFLVALVVATGFYQGRQMAARLPKDGINAQMAVVGKILPAFMGLISLSIPAGVVVYFIVSNLWQIAQQAVTFRNMPLPDAPAISPKADNAKAANPKAGNAKGAIAAGKKPVKGPKSTGANGAAKAKKALPTAKKELPPTRKASRFGKPAGGAPPAGGNGSADRKPDTRAAKGSRPPGSRPGKPGKST